MKIAIASDHGGFQLKQGLVPFLKDKLRHHVIDCGCENEESCDYPDFAKKALALLVSGEVERVILICSTGIGMSIVANKYHDTVRAALVYNGFTAKQSVEHVNANVLCLGAKKIDTMYLYNFTEIWLQAVFCQEDRHKRRINKLTN